METQKIESQTPDCYTFKNGTRLMNDALVLGIVLIAIGIWLRYELAGIITGVMGVLFLLDYFFNGTKDYIRMTKEGIEINQVNELSITRIHVKYKWEEISQMKIEPATLKGSYNMLLYNNKCKVMGKYSVAQKECVENGLLSLEDAYHIMSGKKTESEVLSQYDK